MEIDKVIGLCKTSSRSSVRRRKKNQKKQKNRKTIHKPLTVAE